MAQLLHFEHKTQPLLPVQFFYNRLMRNIMVGIGILVACLMLGTIGYHETCYGALGQPLPWVDSMLNAAMILSGMGPMVQVDEMSDAGKWFASFYALFSGVVFISTIGIVIAPVAHRVLHRFHLEAEEEEEKEEENEKPRNAQKRPGAR